MLCSEEQSTIISTMTTSQKDWLDQVRGDKSQNAIARALDMSSGNLSTALKGEKLSAENIIAISYYLEIDPVQALVDTGYLHREKSDTPAQIAARVRQDITRLEDMAKQAIEHQADIYQFPGRSDPYSDDMPEGAAAYGGELFDTDADNDY